MFRNKAFQRAMLSLAHPLAITAALVLLLNALVFQPNAPSWWTGKIGDAAWLLFAPFLIAALLAWLIPVRWKQQEQIVGIAALTIAGFGFAAVKTIPAFNALVADSFRALTGYPAKLSLDPTDLLALPSLLAAGWLWNRDFTRAPHRARQGLALAFAMLAVLADSPAPVVNETRYDLGFVCLSSQGDHIFAYSGEEVIQESKNYNSDVISWSAFRSEDGGLNWSEGSLPTDPCSEQPHLSTKPIQPTVLRDPEDANIQYLVSSGQDVLRSSDAGKTWQTEQTLGKPKVVGAILHQPTRNLVMLTYSEVYVRTAGGEWYEISFSLGRYSRGFLTRIRLGTPTASSPDLSPTAAPTASTQSQSSPGANLVLIIAKQDGLRGRPYGLAVDAQGNLYVAQYTRIQKFDGDGNWLADWGTYGKGNLQFDSALAVALDSQGNILVTDSGNNCVQKLDRNGKFLMKWGARGTAPGQFDYPEGIAVDAQDNVYVSDRHNNRVQKFDSNGKFLAQWRGDNAKLDPSGIAVDRQGNVYVNGCISISANDRCRYGTRKFDNTGTLLKFATADPYADERDTPLAIALDTLGNLYVTVSSAKGDTRVDKFDSTGKLLATWGNRGDVRLIFPDGIAVDAQGNVYVSEAESESIFKFQP